MRVVWRKRDRYGRILGDMYVGDRHVNLDLAREGLAWHYRQFSKSRELAAAELEARREKRR